MMFAADILKKNVGATVCCSCFGFMQFMAPPASLHRVHGRQSLHFAFLALQGMHAAAALERRAIRRALCRGSVVLNMCNGFLICSFLFCL
jgi:hypothetical protein